MELDGLRVLSVTDLEGLPLLNVADVERQIRTTPYPPSPPPSGVSVGGWHDLLSAKTSRRNSKNFLGSENPAQRKKKQELAHEPPDWALHGSMTSDGLSVLYSCLPARAIHDRRIRGQMLAVLSCLCLFTSRRSIAWPNQKTMARILGVSQPAVSRAMRKLREAGYIRLLQPKGKRLPGAFQRGRRYQVLVRGNDPLPSGKERELMG
jgi:DNA-binding transcriptional ArsR family regulator